MSVVLPHFLQFSDSKLFSAPAVPEDSARRSVGMWRFKLESLDGAQHLTASDQEFGYTSERLQLLSVLRGLEALDQPSRVTLVTTSIHVTRGIRFGLEQWKADEWHWEDYGRMTPIANADLWQRLDRAMEIHEVRCRTWRVDQAIEPGTSRVPAPKGLLRNRRPRQEADSAALASETVATQTSGLKSRIAHSMRRWFSQPKELESATCI